MSLNDRDYYQVRAEAELKMAQAASNPAAVRAHYTLAGHYLDRAYSEAGEQGLGSSGNGLDDRIRVGAG